MYSSSKYVSCTEYIVMVVIMSYISMICGHPVPYARPVLPKQSLLPEDHLDSVRLEADGHLNRDYRREIFFGEDHDKIQPRDKADEIEIIKTLFTNIDINKDDKVTRKELIKWITSKVQEHLDAAILICKAAFKHLDTNNDGLVSWKDFVFEFYLASGYNETVAKAFLDNPTYTSLSEEHSRSLLICQHHWSYADDDLDGSLNLTEFISFRHPELQASTQRHLAEQLLNSLDKDSDGKLTEREFAQLPDEAGVVVELPFPGAVNDDDKWVEERKNQFKTLLDVNHDGIASLDELVMFVKPASESSVTLEVDNVMKMTDHNADDVLVLEEMLSRSGDIIGSQLVNAGAKMHEEL